MSSYGIIVLAAGQGKRMKLGRNKQFISLQGKPLFIHTIETFMDDPTCQQCILVINPQESSEIKQVLEEFAYDDKVTLVHGGKERQDSVYAGLQAIKDTNDVVLIHDGARPFVHNESVQKLVSKAQQHGSALLAVPVTDTIKQYREGTLQTLNRSELWAAQTPQAFQYSLLLEAHQKARETAYIGTDDTSLVERLGYDVEIVQGSYDNIKLTTPEDIQKAETILRRRTNEGTKEEAAMFRVGQGFDVHQLVDGRPCIIGGVEIPYEQGLLGHSDADVLLHTVADACLGAIGEGDIGKHFPDTDPEFKDADSMKLLEHVWGIVKEKGYMLGNIDCTIIAQAPKMSPYTEEMQSNIARILEADSSQVNVKATTTEKLGFPGRKEGVAAQATVLLTRSESL